jgi:hypothetical protein
MSVAEVRPVQQYSTILRGNEELIEKELPRK